ncbi:hypothetical protein QYE76_016424 [Lolium multiflorum]|uniref:Uncharacterized protein n=1 Tax=Lolium multiflorum TaxID=4521 RepID=A0AAD8V9P6_LOLMU|nr:hypothetical protein QYE76_016424 [Lolium multiflorum]
MVKKKIHSAAASSTSIGAAARSSSVLAKEVAPNAPPPAPAPPPSSTAKPGDWTASTITKRDEKRGSSEPVDFCTVEHTSPFNEPDDPIDSETAHANLPPSAGDTCDTEGSVRDNVADHNAFVDAAAEETRASPMKRSIGGFADEDDLLDFDDTFTEPSPKRAKSDAAPPAAAASEASAPKAAPVMQASTASSLSKGKDAPSAAAAPSSDLRGVISSLEAFASQFTSLEADKIRLQEEAKSSSSKLDNAIKKAAIARQEVDSLKEELNRLKERLKEEEVRAAEKDELLREICFGPACREFLDKGKGALARMHSMIFPKATQEKTLGQLVDAFAVDTKEVIEVFPVPSFIDDSSGVRPESDRIQRMKDRIVQMEKDLRSTYALAAIINKKGEIAANVERYALTELHKATESLNFPPTLLALMSEFGNAKKVRDLVRVQVFAGAKFTLALVLARYPSAGLLSIANVTGDLEVLYPKVLLPANMIVDRLEKDSKVPEEKETLQG